MKLNQQQRELLAAEYVLGSLQGGSRRRFERLLRDDSSLQQKVSAWNKYLNPLATQVRPVAPPAWVWQSLLKKIDEISAPVRRKTGWWQALFLWRSMALVASMATIALGVYIWQLVPPEPITITIKVPVVTPKYLAVLQDEKSKPAWLISADPQTLQVQVKTLKSQTLPRDKDFELWMLPGAQQAPISLGLVPKQGDKSLPITQGLLDKIRSAQAFAVSVEPKGGSLTGAPTGPVRYQGVMYQF